MQWDKPVSDNVFAGVIFVALLMSFGLIMVQFAGLQKDNLAAYGSMQKAYDMQEMALIMQKNK